MTSLISWLDASTEENTRMRELVKLFGTPETTDDLGTGQLRDAISNSLFPGTSVLHLGARYMLLVPWSFQAAHRSTRNPDVLRARAEDLERDLIDRLRQLGEESFIGRDAGRNVQQLPSAAYWSALRRYGIVNPDVDRATIGQLMTAELRTPEEGENAYFVWLPSLPKMPHDFPSAEENGLRLTHAEARWLQERILSSCPGTMLAHLVGAPAGPSPDARYPWLENVCRSANGDTLRWLNDAEIFSLIHNGANILYQHLLAERSAMTFHAESENVNQTESLLADWEDQRAAKQELVAAWDVEDFLRRAKDLNRGISSSTVGFARIMFDAASRPQPLTDNQEIRTAVEHREKLMKKGNSRFRNERRLRVWQPPVQVAALGYRWTQVRRTILDIHVGLERKEVIDA
ncbi:DUF6361 family protein [Arthrobacter monumenti]